VYTSLKCLVVVLITFIVPPMILIHTVRLESAIAAECRAGLCRACEFNFEYAICQNSSMLIGLHSGNFS
jgi:hypothetical protein